MKYNFPLRAKEPRKHVYLAGWHNPEDNTTYFEMGERREWFRYHHKGHQINYETHLICVYPPPYGLYQGMNLALARKIARAYVTGDCIRIDIDLADRS